MRTWFIALTAAGLIAGGAAAQTTTTTTTHTQTSSEHRESSTPGSKDKASISKDCSDQANAKGLHGKARKKFRSECKRQAEKG